MRQTHRLIAAAAVVALLGITGCAGDSGAGPAPSPPRTGATTTRSTELTVTSTTRLSDRMLDLIVSSPAAGQRVPVRILLPARYPPASGTLPVVLLLHGCCDDYRSWTRSTDVVALSAHTQALVVMPDGGRVGFYSNWLKGPRWEDFHLIELAALLTRDYHASDRWAVAGVSMGGLGALGYAARHPDRFAAAASFSGVADTLLDDSTARGYQNLLSAEGQDPAALWGDPVTGVQVWKAHNPYDLAAKLRGTKLYISAGSGRPGPGDNNPEGARIEQSLRVENDALARRLKSLGVPATIHFYDPGVHDWPYWQRELHRAWPLLTAAIGAGT